MKIRIPLGFNFIVVFEGRNHKCDISHDKSSNSYMVMLDQSLFGTLKKTDEGWKCMDNTYQPQNYVEVIGQAIEDFEGQ